MQKENLIIIGAGLCGLYSAYLLEKKYNVTILEARDRIGGRVFGIEEHDLGPSWVWPHNTRMLELVETLGLKLFPQYTKGEALYDVSEGVQRFDAPPSMPSFRVEGGFSVLIDALYNKLKHTKLKLNHQVLSIQQKEKALHVKTNQGEFIADKVICTLPPRLANSLIKYEPKLEQTTSEILQSVPTWMGYATKCVIEYENAFWKEKGLSGFVFSYLGPMSEIHDATTANHAALFGFLHVRAKLNKKAIDKQLKRLFGEVGVTYTNMYIHDWKEEIFSSSKEDARGLRTHPDYGFSFSHFDGQLIFSGTESSFQDGGYLEGALNAALSINI